MRLTKEEKIIVKHVIREITCCSPLGGKSVKSVTGVNVDNTDPFNPIINSEIEDNIIDGVLNKGASQNIIFKALALKLDKSDYNDRFLGKYSTLSELELAYPVANPGDYAQVDLGFGTKVVNYNWDSEDGWVPGADGSGATTTDELPEGASNLYFLSSRVRNTQLSGFTLGANTSVTTLDTILSGFGKVQTQLNNKANDSEVLHNNADQLLPYDFSTNNIDAKSLSIFKTSGPAPPALKAQITEDGDLSATSIIKRLANPTNILLAGGGDLIQNTAFNKNFGTTTGTVVQGGTLGTNAYSSTSIFRQINNETLDLNTNPLGAGKLFDATNAPNPGAKYGPYLGFGTTDYQIQLNADSVKNSDLYYRSNGDTGVGAWRALWHSGNFTPSDYLPLTGGAIAGTLKITNDVTSGTVYKTTNDNVGGMQLLNNSSSVLWQAGFGLIEANESYTFSNATGIKVLDIRQNGVVSVPGTLFAETELYANTLRPFSSNTLTLLAGGSNNLLVKGNTNVQGSLRLGDDLFNSTIDQAGIAKITSEFTDRSYVKFFGHTGSLQNNLAFSIDGRGNGIFTGTVTANGTVLTSDKRLKNILKRDGDVAYFKWKNKSDDKEHIGYIAQEVEKNNPDQVTTDNKGMKSVNYVEILVQKVRRLEIIVNNLKK